MHDTALEIGEKFFRLYLQGLSPYILELGSSDVNGSLRTVAPTDANYVGIDIETSPSVDIVLEDEYVFPFEDCVFDAVVSSSVFEHSQMFWLSFCEMARVTKVGGYIYINAPSNGYYHAYPYDNWRFYPDAALALAIWSGRSGFAVTFVESFTARRKGDRWNDFVMVFRRGESQPDELPAQLLADVYTNAYNIRTYRSPEVINLEARSEDMLLGDACTSQLADVQRECAGLEEEAQALRRQLEEADRRMNALAVELGREIQTLGIEAGRHQEWARHLSAERGALNEWVRSLEHDVESMRLTLRQAEQAHRHQMNMLEQARSAERDALREASRVREAFWSERLEEVHVRRTIDIKRFVKAEEILQFRIEKLQAQWSADLESAAAREKKLLKDALQAEEDLRSHVESSRDREQELGTEIKTLSWRLDMAENEISSLNDVKRGLQDKLEKLALDLGAARSAVVEIDKACGAMARESSRFAHLVATYARQDDLYRGTVMGLIISSVKTAGQRYAKAKKKIRQKYFGAPSDVERLLRPLFDKDYYYGTYEDVRAARVPALRHFIEYGWRERRNPNPYFDTEWYLSRNADVQEADVNPLEHYIRHGWMEGRNPSPAFDIDFYLRVNDDVRIAGVEPLTHYLLHGRQEGRLPAATASRAATFMPAHASASDPRVPGELRARQYEQDIRALKVVMISSDSASPSHVYRVENMARGLRQLGCEVEIVPLHELWRVIDRISEFHAAVFWRIAIGPRFRWSGDIEKLLRDCRDNGVATFFDVDDLVFDPSICTPQFVDGLRYLNEEQLALYDEGVRGYRDLMLACGNALVTTGALRRSAERFRVRTFEVPNGLDARYEEALDWPLVQHQRSKIVIGYTPGTRTHQRDFAEAAGALATLLARHVHVQLWVLGPLDLGEFPALERLLDKQVFLNPAVGRDRVFTFNQRIDINIVPLELDNPFTAAKSELKYFEAAVFGVPTVASNVGPYAECISDGENGFVASNEAEWLEKLSLLVTDETVRHELGRNANMAVAARYRAVPIATTMLNAFQAVRSDMRLKAAGGTGWTPDDLEEQWPVIPNHKGDHPLTVNWIISGLIVGGGGHRMLLRAAYHLSRFGHHVRLYFTDTDLNSVQLRELLHRHFFPIECPIYVYSGSMRPADVVFATYWKTVEIALRHRDVCDNMFYFVQDFEPYFFAMGSDYIRAENTYREGLYAITAGPWCTHFIRSQFDGEADYFTFPIENVYCPGAREKKNKNVVFFAKPEMPRRCYEIGVEVLKEVHALRPDVEIIMFGSRHVDANALPFPATCRNVLSVSDLAQMYRDADIGLAFSPTNPSAVPYEMMACGLPVVDMARPFAEENYGGRFDIVTLANPVPARMAKEIVKLLDDPEECARRSAAGLEFIKDFPTEEEMGRRIETLVVDRVAWSKGLLVGS